MWEGWVTWVCGSQGSSTWAHVVPKPPKLENDPYFNALLIKGCARVKIPFNERSTAHERVSWPSKFDTWALQFLSWVSDLRYKQEQKNGSDRYVSWLLRRQRACLRCIHDGCNSKAGDRIFNVCAKTPWLIPDSFHFLESINQLRTPRRYNFADRIQGH